jgi:uroporphyrinogen decarboxylase
MRRYLELQVEAGADVVQVFDSWAGLLARGTFVDLVAPAVRAPIEGLAAPPIYFAPHASHLLDLLPATGAVGYGVDWRQPIGYAWERIGRSHPIQGNLDPAVLLTDPATVERAVAAILGEAGAAPGHIFNLGHGILPSSPIENVAAMVAAVQREAS